MVGKEKYFVDRRDEGTSEKLSRFARAKSLFGTGARVEEDGTILIRSWREEESGTITPDQFSSLSKRKKPDRDVMRRGLKSKEVSSQVISQYATVEDAIKSVDYILEGQKKELRQVEVVRKRTRELIDYFERHRISSIPPEERERLQQETLAMLSEVGLDPDMVKLEIKQLMILWTVKGSSGKDSLDRDNELIAFQELYAAERRARKREKVVRGNITLKYSQIGGGLVLARSSARQNTFEVGDEVENRLIRNIYMVDPETPIFKDLDHTIKKIDSLSELLEDVLVNPYRNVALLGLEHLKGMKELLEMKTREALYELHNSGLIQGMIQVMSLNPEVGKFGKVLEMHAEVDLERLH
jgi:hypothetical protein